MREKGEGNGKVHPSLASFIRSWIQNEIQITGLLDHFGSSPTEVLLGGARVFHPRRQSGLLNGHHELELHVGVIGRFGQDDR